MALHKDLTGDDLHEPKGLAGTAASLVYVSNGSGTGTWKKIGNSEIDRTGISGLTTRTQALYHPSIRTANKAAYTAIQVSGTLTRIAGIIDGSPTEDVTITFTKNSVTNIGSILIPSGSAEGSQFAVTVNPVVSFVQGDFIKALATGGAGGTLTVGLSLQLLFTNS